MKKKDVNEQAATYLSRRRYTREELRAKLVQDGFSEEDILLTIDSFTSDGYINDQEYVKVFIEQKRRYHPLGLITLQFELEKRGIPGSLLDNLREEKYTFQDEVDDCTTLLQKWMPGDDDRETVFHRLMRRGFVLPAIEDAWSRFQK
ncbi:MAG: regulatory protein RecX, partial [Atribacterota bacterium]